MFSRVEDFFRPNDEQPTFLFFFRVMIGIIALVDLLSLLPDLPLIYGDTPALGPSGLLYLQTDDFQYLHPIRMFLDQYGLLGYLDPGLLLLYGGVLVFLIRGLVTRPVALVALLLHFFIYKSFSNLNYGFDFFTSMSLFYCLLFPVGKAYSLDNLLLRNRPPVQFNYKRMLLLHVSIAYLYTGIAKAIDIEWYTGEGLWRALTNVDTDFYALPPVVLLLGCWATLIIELSHPFLIWHEKTKHLALLGVIGLHLGIAYTMGLVHFSAIMIVWNVAAIATFRTEKAVAHEMAI